jgi:choline transport protein
MEQAKSHSEVIDREVVYDSNAGFRPEATSSFSISDDDILRAQGHKAVFKRSFSIVSTLGFAFKYVSHLLYFPLIMLNYLVSRMLGLAR